MPVRAPTGLDRHEPEFLAEWDDAITKIEHDAGAELFPQLIAQRLQCDEARGRHPCAPFDFDTGHYAVGLFQHHLHGAGNLYRRVG